MKSKLLALFVILFVGYVQGQNNTLDLAGLSASTPAASAYGLRKLSNAYTGSAIQVRRSNDNATLNIGFNALGDLDTIALLSFVGTNDGFVTIWYDQSGNSRNLTQPTVNKQPTIVSGGVIKKKSNRPTVFFDIVDDGMLQAGADYLTSGDLSVNMVSGSNSYSTSLRRAAQGTNNWLIGPYQNLHSWFASDFNHQVNEPWLLYSTEVFTIVQPTGTPNTSWRNGVSVSSSNFKSYPNKIQLSNEGSYPEPLRGFISEVIAFNLELSTSDRQALETNQLAYYPVNSVDLKLSDLIIIGNPLSPSFDSNTSNYSIPLLPNETESISVKPISSSNLTRWAIKLNSGDYQDIPTGIATDISIPPGVHTLYVSHLALDNTVVNTYSITVERARATVNWTGATNTDWNTASNWDTGILPINGSDVIIPGGLTNYPIVATDSSAHANSIIIQASDASLTMNSGSNLELNGFTPDIEASIQVYGQFTNSGNLTIGTRNTVGNNGIKVESGSFNNTTSGLININRTMNAGIYNTFTTTISNSGNITIGGQASTGSYGIYVSSFTNNSTGNININRSLTTGFNATGALINNGKITIGALSTVGSIGLSISGGFTNGVAAEIRIDRCTTFGLRTTTSGNSANNGKIVIGALSSGMANAMTLARNFTNGPQGIIELDNYTGSGMTVNGGAGTFTFTNNGKITIGAIAAGSTGISSNFVFNNNSSGVINIDRTSTGITSSTRNFTNSGKIIVGASNIGNNNVNMSSVCLNNTCASFQIFKGNLTINGSSLTNNGLLQVKNTLNINGGKTLINNAILNYGILNNSGTLQNNTSASIIINDSNPLFSYGSMPYNGTIEGIYTDPQATVSAGTFTQPNTFTPIGLPNALNTLYVKITPSGGACSYVIPFIYNMVEATHLNFDGVDDHITLPSVNNIPSGNSNYTIEAWINPSEIGEKGIIGWGNYGQDNQVNALRLTPNGIKNFWWNNDLEVNYSFNTDTWYQVAASYNGSVRKIYIDGILVGQDTLTIANNVSNTSNLTIGLTNTNEFFKGSIDDIRIWNVERSESQIFNSKNCELQGNENGLVAYYKFNQGYNGSSNASITSLTDATANGNNGSLNNFTLNGLTSNWLSGHSMNQSTSNATTVSSCGTYTWPINTITYTSSGTYYFSTPCHTDILNLTIKQPTTATLTQTACTSYTLNGTTYTSSGTYTQTLTNAVGCDSTITLNLTINQPTSATLTQTACSSYTLNGTTYNTSGTYTQTLTNAAGCDSTITLNLTIKQSTASTTNISACNTYIWANGVTYTTSGVYSQTLVNAQGCDSIATLNLTIKHSTASTTNISACNSYTWTNGVTYTTSGTRTQTLVNVAGCDSVATLNLTIKHSSTSTTNISACNTYTWTNGTTYNTSGTYTQTLVNAQGCDSVATLDLTILPTPTNQTVTIYPLTSVCQAVATVTVASTQTGYNYYLRNDSDNSIVQGPVAGTGSAINFTPQTVNATHTYNVYVVPISPSTYGMNFDGTNDYIELSNINLANSSYTLETQFKTTVGGRVITIGSSLGASYEQTGIKVSSNGNIAYYFYGDDGIVNGTNAANGAWHHVAFSFDNVTKVGVLYLDGVQIGTRTFGNNLHGSGLARLGSRNWGGSGDYYNGQLDDVRIWNVVRTGTQISSNVNSCLTGAEAGLVALYNFDEGPINSTTTDATTHGHTGTMTNMNSTTNWITGIPGCAVTGCPIVLTTHPTVTITQPAGSSSSVSACNSYTWSNGVTYTTSGTYSRIIPSALGCDSTLTLNLTIKHSTTSTTNISACNTYTWTNGTTYNTSGTFTQTLVNAVGCDSVATLNLTIKHSTTSTTNISACNTYTWTNGTTYSTSGVYSQTLVNAAGCDSVATLNLTIKHSSASITNISACNTYTWTNGTTYTTSGVYSQMLVNSQGCDSVATLNLTIKHSSASTMNISACNTYTWTNGTTYTTSGVYSQMLVNSQGCDSVATLNLTIKHSSASTTNISACNTYTWTNGTAYTTSGMYTQTLVNSQGCDSVATLNLTIKHSTTSATNISACNTYTWTNGTTYTTSGVYSQTLVNAAGCDSVATLNLTIKHSTTSTTNISACNTYTWTNGTTYTTSGVYSQTLVNSQGCDSVATLNLTIKHSSASTTNISACNTYTWTNGTTYITSGTHTQTLVNAVGCDSIATLVLTINQPTSSTTTITQCGGTYTWTNGTTYNTSGTHTQTLVNAVGCDSIATLVLTINQPTSSTTTITQCGGTYTWTNGTTYNASGTHTQTLMNAVGCDSIVTLVLTINQPTSSTTTITQCGGTYTWTNGTTYNTSGTHTQTLVNAVGCDSIATLVLTINQSTSSTTTITQCGGTYTWTNGTTYNTSGTHTQTLMNAVGCDSIATLVLTINQPTSSTTTITQCGGTYTWTNGTTYNTSGTYTQTLVNAVGCDSIATLVLTINQPTSSTTTITQCEGTYTWTNGTTYNASGTYTQTLVNALGCDSVATLDLVITGGDFATATYTGDSSLVAGPGAAYQWVNCETGSVIVGETADTLVITSNGSYAVIITNANGCSDTSECVVIEDLGVKQVSSLELEVYPNPTRDVVYLEMSVASADVIVYDASGKIINQMKVNSGEAIDFRNVERGVYFLHINAENSQTVKRIVKQ